MHGAQRDHAALFRLDLYAFHCHNRAPVTPWLSSCGFCSKPISLTDSRDQALASVGRAALCRHCGAAYLLDTDDSRLRSRLGAVLKVAGERLQLSLSPCVADGPDGPLYLACGWDPGEMLSTIRVAHILEVHRATVQQHVRQGKFPGAVLQAGSGNGARGFWQIPRWALDVYLRGKGKPALVVAGVRGPAMSAPTMAASIMHEPQ